MMNHEREVRTKDPAQKRLGYLWDMADAASLAMFGCVVACVFGLIALLCVGAMLFVAIVVGPGRFDGLPYLLGVGFSILLASLGGVLWRSAARRGRQIPYVPPVREQLFSLPADEVLVRGSEPPAATSEELLRAASASSAATAEDLLRPDDQFGSDVPEDRSGVGVPEDRSGVGVPEDRSRSDVQEDRPGKAQ